MNRSDIFDQIGRHLLEQITYIDNELIALIADLSNETKSSAGDKFETAREMIQQERVKLEQSKTQKTMLFAALNQLKDKNNTSTIQSGSLIQSDKGIFILGLALGKVQLENNSVIFGLGLNSPLGKGFLNKSAGDSFELNGILYQINQVC